jgi:hypothetical protein
LRIPHLLAANLAITPLPSGRPVVNSSPISAGTDGAHPLRHKPNGYQQETADAMRLACGGALADAAERR